MSTNEGAEEHTDQLLIAGALAGDPAELAELARRFALLPRLLSQWNQQRNEPLDEEQQIERACSTTISLWQRVPSYTAVESFDAWLARQSAGCMDLRVPAEAPSVLAAALAQSQGPGDAEARDALAIYRAKEALNLPPSGEQRPIWGVIAVLGVIAVFLALSPLSPWQWQPSSDSPAEAEPAAPAIALVAPLGSVKAAKLFEWSGPTDQTYTLVIEYAGGDKVSQGRDLSAPSHELPQSLPPGNYRWRVLPSDSDLEPSPWSELLVEPPRDR